MKNQDTKLTREQRIAHEAKIAALKAEAEVLSKALLEEEEEAAEEVEETTVEVEETATNVANDQTQEDIEEASEEVEETSNEEDEEKPTGFAKFFKGFLGFVGVLALVGILIMLMLMYFQNNNVDPSDPSIGGTPSTTPVDPSNTPSTIEFDMDTFIVSVENIAKTLTNDNDITTNVNIFVKKIGKDKLVELIDKNSELEVQKAIAEYLAFVPEIKMNQYISNNKLDYNLDAENDWFEKIDVAEEAYQDAMGKNPEGAFMSLEGYDTYKNDRDIMKALITKTGDTALLTWYEAKTTGYDLMVKQQRDTEKAHAYKEEAKLELVENINGSIKLIELQLEQKVNGTNADTLEYTEVYEEFIISNYMYVIAN